MQSTIQVNLNFTQLSQSFGRRSLLLQCIAYVTLGIFLRFRAEFDNLHDDLCIFADLIYKIKRNVTVFVQYVGPLLAV